MALGWKLWSCARFNIEITIIQNFLANLFFIISYIDIASYADDNSPYIAADNIDDLNKSLEKASNALFQWLNNNLLKKEPWRVLFTNK